MTTFRWEQARRAKHRTGDRALIGDQRIDFAKLRRRDSKKVHPNSTAARKWGRKEWRA